ncbi:ATP-binding cassette domain-containing protein [Microbulbifer bruguierae]|uniref:ATP-binding cassette domain-containing protein n=1 Tax=Microbulbifer bruguierae TaxID=3029061 RepID=A0ABY8NIP3_9GAMM|nr:ATP-binding cassette domain-containing protein [Microbulbifer bruguierae]WGL17597.1 ATP-binding cassette domain-containing protein [Microbulbifer bruguierae]
MIATLRNVQVAYPASTGGDPGRGLEEINLALRGGEHVAIIGPSGAGKSTLLRLLATAQRPSAGYITLADCNPWGLGTRARQRLRTRIGLIQQSPPLPPRQRVVTAISASRTGQWPLWKSLANLAYPLDMANIARELSKLDLSDKIFQRCGQLSGGELQRAAIARTLYQRAEIILADEPVSAMDPVLAEHTLDLLNRECRQYNATLVVSLHNLQLALKYFPRVIGLRHGRIQFDKAAAEISQHELDALYANEQLRPTAVAHAAAWSDNRSRC